MSGDRMDNRLDTARRLAYIFPDPAIVDILIPFTLPAICNPKALSSRRCVL